MAKPARRADCDGWFRPDTIAKLAPLPGCRTRGKPDACGGARRSHRQPQSLAQQTLVRQLLSDRAQLLAAQQAAALKVLAVDERLAEIELQIQQRNQEYQQRIDALLKELVAAREENRALIRARIALVQAEMEKARLKAAPRPHGQQ